MTLTWLGFAVAFCAPLALLLLVNGLLHWLPENEPPRWLRPALAPLARYLTSRKPVPEPIPVILFELELRRIADQLALAEESDQPHKALRLAAWRGAYDLALTDFARGLGQEPPAPPLSAAQRADLELTLVGAGHLW